MLFNDRKEPLVVTDEGGTSEDGHYLVLRGPRGGTYTIREQWDDERGDWRVAIEGDREISDLRFADPAADPGRDLSYAEGWVMNRAYEQLADDSTDYSEFERAAHDVARDFIAQADHDQLVYILAEADKEVLPVEGFNDPDRAVALSTLLDRVERDAEYASSTLRNEAGAGTFEKLVDRTVRIVEDERDRGNGPDDIENHAHLVAGDLLDRFSTAEHVEIVEDSTRSPQTHDWSDRLYELVPWGEREQMARQATSVVALAALDEIDEDLRADLNAATISQELRRWYRTILNETPDFSDLKRPETPQLPLLSDGGMPHTLADEARILYLKEVPIVSGGWTLQDAGLVTDGENRQMAWINPDRKEMLVIAGTNRGNRNDWGVYTHDFETDTTTEIQRGRSFTAAFNTASDYISPRKDEATIELIEDDEHVTVVDSVDHTQLGRNVLSLSGFARTEIGQVAGAIPGPVRTAGSITGRGLLGIGRATGRATTTVGGRVWDAYGARVGELMLAAIVTALLNQAAKVVQGAEYEPEVDPNRLGAHASYKRGTSLLDEHGNSRISGWEVVREEGSIQRDSDGRILMRSKEDGEERWMDPEQEETLFNLRKTINPYRWGIDKGTTLAWGVGHDEVVELFEDWGEDAIRMTFGSGERSKSEGRNVRSPKRTGAPGNPYRSRSSSSSSSSSSSGRSRSSSRRSRSSGSSGSSSSSGSSGGSSGGSYADIIGTGEDAAEDMFERGKDLLGDSARTWLDNFGKDRPEPSTEKPDLDDDQDAEKVGDGESKTVTKTARSHKSRPRDAEEIEEAVGDADRVEQLEFHTNEPDAPDMEVDEDDIETDGGGLDERKERHKAKQREEAADYVDSLPDDEAEDISSMVSQMQEIREQKEHSPSRAEENDDAPGEIGEDYDEGVAEDYIFFEDESDPADW